MSDLAYFARLSTATFPACVSRVTWKEAAWFGLYIIDGARPASIKQGPYQTEQEACDALTAAGWTRRPHKPGLAGPHFDRPSLPTPTR